LSSEWRIISCQQKKTFPTIRNITAIGPLTLENNARF